jgi:hypothetical protein
LDRGAIDLQPKARSTAEDGGERLFCLALQSRRRRKKAGRRHCRKAIEA